MSLVRWLFLLRHAKSSWADAEVDDHERPLNARGARAGAAMGAYLGGQDASVSLILCSSARRTVETLERLRSHLRGEPRVEIERRLYLASSEVLLRRLRTIGDDTGSVLLIGHNPGIAELALRLAGSGRGDALRRLEAKFPTAALATFALAGGSWKEALPGGARLVDFTTPKDLV